MKSWKLWHVASKIKNIKFMGTITRWDCTSYNHIDIILIGEDLLIRNP